MSIFNTTFPYTMWFFAGFFGSISMNEPNADPCDPAVENSCERFLYGRLNIDNIIKEVLYRVIWTARRYHEAHILLYSIPRRLACKRVFEKQKVERCSVPGIVQGIMNINDGQLKLPVCCTASLEDWLAKECCIAPMVYASCGVGGASPSQLQAAGITPFPYRFFEKVVDIFNGQFDEKQKVERCSVPGIVQGIMGVIPSRRDIAAITD
jgi:hypothetical protein